MFSELIHQYNLQGLLIGLATFLIIGLFHPLVIKGEYHFGVKESTLSILLGVTAFSSFWSILEVFEQRERVRKGWFPKKPDQNSTDKVTP
jgi:hypothetical protein